MNSILTYIAKEYPDIQLKKSDTFYWSPSDKTVYYSEENTSYEGAWALLHESGHALLDHKRYYTDFELISMEVEAWEKAKDIASDLKITIDEDHVQDCLDSYRNWLHKRSLCPDCSLSGIQTDSRQYTCIFCHKKWLVSNQRFCRPYRKGL